MSFDLIYCAGGNEKLARIAIEEGFLYGSRSDDIRSIRCDGLIDVNWKQYSWDSHISAVKEHKPKYAVVPDVLEVSEFDEALKRAEQVIEIGSRPIIVPKIDRVIERIPKEYIVGISVPTGYGGFLPNVMELTGRKVHLLGGSPGQQRELWWYYNQMKVVVCSTDLNSHSKASDFGSYWNGNKWCDDERDSIGKYEAFRKSCQGIIKMWRHLAGYQFR